MCLLFSRSRRLSCCVIAIFLLACCGAASALEPQIPGYVHHVWGVREGLPQNIVARLLASRDGYVWIGANHGVVRFDGITFTAFDIGNTPALKSNRVAAMYESADGTLWIGTSKGLVRYREGVFTAESGDGNFAEGWVRTIAAGPDGQLVAASFDRVYQRDRNGHWSALPIAGLKRITSLIVDRRGSIWIAMGTEVIEWRERTLRTFPFPNQPSEMGLVNTLCEDQIGRIWVGSDGGLSQINPLSGAVTPETGPLEHLSVKQLLIDRDGVLWIGALGTLATRTPDGHVAVHIVANAEDDAQVNALAQDLTGQIWYGIATGPGGLHRLTPRRVQPYTREQGLPCDNIGPVAEGADATIWLGTYCGERPRLVSLKDGRVRSYVHEPNAPVLVLALLPLPDGNMYIGTHGGLVRMQNGQFSPVAGPFRQGLSIITALYRDEDGALWVGTEGEGLACLRDGVWRTWRVEDGLASNDVHTIVRGRDRSIWIGTGLGVTRVQQGRLTSYGQSQGMPPGEVRALYEDEDGALWIGTYGGGLARMKDGRVARFGAYGGLLESSVHRIIEDDRGHLWLSGDAGVRRVSRLELVAIANARGGTPRVDLFDTNDGMASAECNGMGQPAGVRTRAGDVWFPTQGGLVRIDASAIRDDGFVPPVSIESVRVNGVEQPVVRTIVVPPGARDVEIRYGAPALRRPEQTLFRYRFLGQDDAWVEAGTRRMAHFANLAPGAYQFQVSARSGSGGWNQVGATTRLTLEPRFYQRAAFQTLTGSLLAFSVFLGIRWRVRQLDRRATALEAVVAERTRELKTEREELRAAKAELETSHGHLLATFNQLRVGVILVDADARVRFLSEAMQPLVGVVPPEGLVGQPIDRVLPIAPESLASLRGQIRAPQPGVRVTAELVPASGQRYWTEIEVHPDANDPRQRVLHFYDVTETFELKRALHDGAGAVGSTLVGESVAMRHLREEIATIAALDATVLIEGETGTGKELVARAIHDASPRKHRPFVAINCAGLTESLLASQLFGHRRGAFTGAVNDQVGLFEAANGGTLLLDEIGDMPIGVQTHLLRVLEAREILRLGDAQPRPINVRLLAATHRDLEADVKTGRFREDLLYRIRVVRLQLPPLRLRTGDIPLLALTFLRRVRAVHHLSVDGISRDAMAHLQSYAWPGNVRQLKGAIEAAAIRATGPLVKLSDVLPELTSEHVPAARPSTSERERVSDRERKQILDALRQTRGNRSAAARLLGMPRSTFYVRLSRLQAEGVDLPSDTSSRPNTD